MPADRIARRFPSGTVALCTVLIAALWLGLLLDIQKSNETAIDQARRDTENLAIAFREQIAKSVGAIDAVMAAIVDDHHGHPGEYRLPDWFAHAPLIKRLGVEVSLAGPDGIIRTTDKGAAAGRDVSERPYFRHHREASAPQPFISVPEAGWVAQRWSVHLTRRLARADGSFDGVVIVSVDPFQLWKFFDGISLGSNGAAILVGRDGIVRARTARDHRTIGRDLSSTTLLQSLARADAGTYIAINPLDGRERVISYASIPGYPLAVGVGFPTDDVLAMPRRHRNVHLVIGATGSLVILLCAWLIARAANRRHQHDMTMQAQEILRDEKRKLDAALGHMSQGLLMFDDDARLVLCNQRYLEIYGLSPQLVKPGCSMRSLVEQRKALGTFIGDPETYCAEILASIRNGRRSSAEFMLADGRIIHSVNMPVAGGGWVATHEDVTEQLEAQRRIEYLARHDELTGLPSRTFFNEYLVKALQQATENGTQLALLCVNLDRFKEINDVFGHAVGDGLLQEIGKRFKQLAGDAFVARIGGDEFCVVVGNAARPAAAEELASRLQALAEEAFSVNGNSVRCGLSIGVALYPQDGADVAALLANGDAALYRAKREGRGSVRFFQAEMDHQLRERRALQHELGAAIELKQLALFYQPQARIGGEIVGFEALVRWRHPERGLVPPSTFIPLAEDSGLIMQIGEWVLREACREAASWGRPLHVAVNLSPVQFRHGDLPALVHAVLLETGLSPDRLELEITENVLIGDFTRGVAILRRLKALGVRIAMDDFGTGYSSLSYLQAFPFDKIKIDQAFIAKLDQSPQSSAIIRAVIGLARGLKLPVTAEGVETKEQLAFLAQQNCDEIQGYLIGRPQPIESYAELVNGTAGVMPRMARSA